MLSYLFSFEGRINRAKMWRYWLYVIAWEALCLGAIWVIGSIAKYDDPIGDAVFFYDSPRDTAQWLGRIVFCVFLIGYAWTFAAVSVKRLHDRNKAAIWALLFWGTPFGSFAALSVLMMHNLLTPAIFAITGTLWAVIGGVLMWWGLIEILFVRGTRGENRFGSDPLQLQN